MQDGLGYRVLPRAHPGNGHFCHLVAWLGAHFRDVHAVTKFFFSLLQPKGPAPVEPYPLS